MQSTSLKWIDLPPVWLCGALGVSYWIGQLRPWGMGLDFPMVQIFAALLIAAGFLLMILAVWEMRRQKTTVIPHLDATRLVQSGIFKWSRNPIYVGDILVLAGFTLRWDAPLALPLVPLLGWILAKRFITQEEGRLQHRFGAAFERYRQNTRRWI